MDEITNGALRTHVTRVGFDLSMGKSHIAALVYIDQRIKVGVYFRGDVDGPLRKAFANFATGARGLIDRGLLEHLIAADSHALSRWRKRHGREMPPHRIWRITSAGRHVIALLKEAGIYQEYLAALTLPVSEVEEAG